MTLHVKDWDGIYENHNSRQLKKLSAVLVPNRMDTEGYAILLDHKNGPAHLGAWVAILQIASRCKVRGVLANSDGRPYDALGLSRISRIPPELFEELIPRLLGQELQWLEQVDDIAQDSRAVPQDSRAVPRESATLIEQNRTEQNPTEVSGKGGVGEKPEPSQKEPAATGEQAASALSELEQIYKAGGLPIPEKHRQIVFQHMLSMSPEKLERLTRFVKWAFTTGRWPSPDKTKSLLNVIRDGDFDVELTTRTLPQAPEATKDRVLSRKERVLRQSGGGGVIDKPTAAKQIERLWDAALHFLPDSPQELIKALQEAPNERMAADIVSDWIREQPQCPTPSEIHAMITARREQATDRRDHCEMCGGSTWIRRDYLMTYRGNSFRVQNRESLDHLNFEQVRELRGKLPAHQEILGRAVACPRCRPSYVAGAA